ncbi:YlbL family protein [Xylanimonas ulmi]|uniref:endopeptidase La n=1 Tax=Xylanimonas ulmi TaxID=228973 RepID=A0A4Q7LYL9_9MICO|nr:PDZ domain-containing protein [Xylanibacterium ulmi]RZS59781.1 PDZ domain-containing protein [Xylanibacterium ulmi]
MASTQPRTRLLTGSLLVTAALAAATLVLPTGFVVRGPGPTEDTLGAQNDVPLVEITGADTYPGSGELLLTTVSVGGGPVSDVFAADVLYAWASPQRAVLPTEAVFAVGTTREQQQQQSQLQMTTSQQSATAAALTELGFEVPATLTIEGAVTGSPADGVVEQGDVIRTLNGEAVTSHGDLLSDLAKVTPGDDVVLGVERDGVSKDLAVTTSDGTTPDGGRRAALNVFVSSQFDFPIDVSIRIDDIGGPSAGMMFALAIIDRLTPEDELDGQVVAGTGTIDVDGVVGPIGGIEQKMHGALRDGAGWFLAPEANCDEVVGNVPDGLRVVEVSTLAQARDAIIAIGAGDGDALPTCS